MPEELAADVYERGQAFHARPSGLDAVEFLLAAGPAEPLRPLVRCLGLQGLLCPLAGASSAQWPWGLAKVLFGVLGCAGSRRCRTPRGTHPVVGCWLPCRPSCCGSGSAGVNAALTEQLSQE